MVMILILSMLFLIITYNNLSLNKKDKEIAKLNYAISLLRNELAKHQSFSFITENESSYTPFQVENVKELYKIIKQRNFVVNFTHQVNENENIELTITVKNKYLQDEIYYCYMKDNDEDIIYYKRILNYIKRQEKSYEMKKGGK